LLSKKTSFKGTRIWTTNKEDTMWTLKNIAISAAISLGTVLFSVGSYHAGRGVKGAVAKRRERGNRKRL
jgi:hypothetical protein